MSERLLESSVLLKMMKLNFEVGFIDKLKRLAPGGEPFCVIVSVPFALRPIAWDGAHFVRGTYCSSHNPSNRRSKRIFLASYL